MTLFKDTQFVIYREKKWMSPEGELWIEFCDGYWISHWGGIATQHTKGINSKIDRARWEIKNPNPKKDNRPGYKGGYIEFSIYPYKNHPYAQRKIGLEEGRGFQTTVNPDRVRMSLKAHRVVMDTFKPLDEYSYEIGITKEEWNNTPEPAKVFISRQVYVNHKDHNRSNNYIDNLEWTDVVDNAIKKIDDRVTTGDLPNPNERKHYSELTRKQKEDLGHLDRKTEQQVGPF
jgi:hypothetical protein